MPEIPDIEAYIEALRPRVVGQTLLGIRLANPFLLRTVEPPLEAVAGGRVEAIERLGKRIVLEVRATPQEAGLDEANPVEANPAGDSTAGSAADRVPYAPLFVVMHLMIAGRLHWKEVGSPVPKGSGLAALDFSSGSLILTEAGKKRRASLRLVRGREALADLDPGGLEVVGSSPEQFEEVLRGDNRTIKRALTDPHTISGIGNAYSDEILHRARISPLRRTRAMETTEIAGLHLAAVEVLEEWTDRLRAEARESFPREGHGLSPRDGGARAVRPTLPRSVGRLSSASCMRTTNATTVPAARPRAASWPIGLCRAFLETIGRGGHPLGSVSPCSRRESVVGPSTCPHSSG